MKPYREVKRHHITLKKKEDATEKNENRKSSKQWWADYKSIRELLKTSLVRPIIPKALPFLFLNLLLKPRSVSNFTTNVQGITAIVQASLAQLLPSMQGMKRYYHNQRSQAPSLEPGAVMNPRSVPFPSMMTNSLLKQIPLPPTSQFHNHFRQIQWHVAHQITPLNVFSMPYTFMIRHHFFQHVKPFPGLPMNHHIHHLHQPNLFPRILQLLRPCNIPFKYTKMPIIVVAIGTEKKRKGKNKNSIKESRQGDTKMKNKKCWTDGFTKGTLQRDSGR